MLTIRDSDARGHADFGWLQARYTFSFANYHDPAHVHYRRLRVINEDRIQGGGGFPTHGHEDMEILTYVLDGRLRHEDSTGGAGELGYGDVQVMSAGTGVTHSEANASPTDSLHLLQIWILPDRKGHEPAYREAKFDRASKVGQLRPIASPEGTDGALQIHQDARVFASILEADGEPIEYEVPVGRGVWIQTVRGAVTVGERGDESGQELAAGDGASVDGPAVLRIRPGPEEAEFLLFDLV